MLGNSDGTFKNGETYSIAGNYSVAAVVDDVNGDGIPDIIAVSGDQQISVLPGKGDGTFGAAISFTAPLLSGYASASQAPIMNLITADLRGVGKRDLIASNGLVFLGNGDGTFTAASNPAFPYVVDNLSNNGPFIAAGDLNNDGKIDLAVSDNETVGVWFGKGDGSFTRGPSYDALNSDGYISITDLDGDGNADIYVGLGDGAFYGGDEGSPNLAYALMGKGDGTFEGAPLSPGTYNGNNLGDVNGDGIPDVVSNSTDAYNNTSSPAFTVSLGSGKGTFTSGSTVVAPASFTGTTSALLSPVTIIDANTVAAASYALADVNGDGKADLVFVDNGLTALNPSNNQPFVYPVPIYFVALSKGDGTFAAPIPYNFPQIAPASGFDDSVTAANVQIADFNHDGHPDLIFTYNAQAGGPGTVPYYQGFAVLTGKATAPSLPPPPSPPHTAEPLRPQPPSYRRSSALLTLMATASQT